MISIMTFSFCRGPLGFYENGFDPNLGLVKYCKLVLNVICSVPGGDRGSIRPLEVPGDPIARDSSSASSSLQQETSSTKPSAEWKKTLPPPPEDQLPAQPQAPQRRPRPHLERLVRGVTRRVQLHHRQ